MNRAQRRAEERAQKKQGFEKDQLEVELYSLGLIF